ncbi:hypothetical protein Gxy13693_074_008 [Komagataeibacter xylinus NBRC 13693]|uniref:Entry exclusion protein n=1 Tax=Komagataeibacter xylinus NBRC 13693 TaxID=1234668 RepID=A0A0D6QDA3_KOMXY|nr:EexN family lipoprotein [Komagataeibacter xylinus]RCL04349.1 hypothetical protein BBA71_13700 [Acetobacter pasteurianus]GAO00961.1 hypothetical protein Gxy13693_074_008 [Komagataeibacter xylinus NBRC 13693]
MKKLTIFLALLSLAGCKKHHDKNWYDSHEKERSETIKKCTNDAEYSASPDCQNAIDSSAFSKKDYGNFNPTKDMP